jgi:hypothetical protein
MTTLVPLRTRIEPEMRAQVRDYQRQEADLPPLSEAVRRLIRLGLKAAHAAQENKLT